MASTINLGNVVGNTISGLASGIDTENLIKQLSQIKQKPIDDANTKITANDTKVTKFADLSSKLSALRTALNYLRNPSGLGSNTANIFQYRLATLSSSTLISSSYLSVTANPGALVGNSSIQIGQLAAALAKRSGAFNARDVDATTAATGSYFTAGSFQIGSGIVNSVAGTTKSGFTLSTGDYAVEGSGSGVLTSAGIHAITVVGGSGGQTKLQGSVSGFTGTLGSGTATFTVSVGGVTYTSNAVDVTQVTNTTHAGIQAGTDITFTADSGGVNETSFKVTTASDIDVDDTSSNVTTFATNLGTAVSSQNIFQSRKISNFTDTNVKSPITGLTNNNIKFYSNAFGTTSAGAFGDISGFKVQASTGSDGIVSVTINGETFRATGLGTTLNTNLTLQSTSTYKQLKINLGDAGVSVDISSDANAANFSRSLDYAFGTRELKTITVDSGDTLNDVIYSINSNTATTGASASITKVSDADFRFTIKANNEGVANRYDIFDDSGVLTHASLTTTQSDQDAKIKVDGVEIKRSTNSISDAVDNVTLDLLAVTPGYGGGSPDTIDVKVENDIDTVTAGIKNFLDAYNTIRVFYAEQNQRDVKTNAYTKDAILGGDTTLQNLVNQLSTVAVGSVSNATSSVFDALTDLGITVQDFAGDATNVATKNILVYDEATLKDKLTQNYNKVREIFEFNATTSSTALVVSKSSNDFTLSSFKLEINSSNAVGQQIKLLNSDGSEYLSGGQPVYLDAEGSKITGQAGTPVAGLEFIYSGDGTDTISVNLSQGLADRFYNLVDTYTKSGGIIDTTKQDLGDKNTAYETDILSLQVRLDAYIKSLREKFSALEKAISSVNNILQLLDANTAAANKNG